jgi:hypothetical protein
MGSEAKLGISLGKQGCVSESLAALPCSFRPSYESWRRLRRLKMDRQISEEIEVEKRAGKAEDGKVGDCCWCYELT